MRPKKWCTRLTGSLLGQVALVCLLLRSTQAHAEDHRGGFIWRSLMAHRDTQNHAYVRRFDRFFSPRLTLGTKATTFGFLTPGARQEQKRYYPNAAASVGIGLFFGKLGLMLSTRLSQNQSDRVAAYGKTKFFDLSLNVYQMKFGGSAYYQSYRGFFEGPDGFGIPKLNVDQPYPQRPDILLRNTGIYGYGIDNWRKFSMEAAFRHTRRQVRSAGSFLYMGNLQYLTIRGDSDLSTPLAAGGISEQSASKTIAFSRGRFLSLSALAGYGHTFVVKRLFVTGVLFVGPGLQYQHLLSHDSDRDRYFSPYLATQFKGSLGYNGDRFFGSFQIMADGSRNYMNGVRLQANTNSALVQVGMRF